MLDELHDDPGAEGRYLALTSADREGLVHALYDASWRVRRRAAELLSLGSADESLVRRLIEVLGDRGHPGARNAAAGALAQVGHAATRPLLDLLAHDDPDQRKLAADILGERRDGSAVDALERALSDADANVQGAAAEALGNIGGSRASRALMRLLDSPQAQVRACALDALFALRQLPPLPQLAAQLPGRAAFRLLGLVENPSAYMLVSRALEAQQTRDAALLALGVARPWPHEAEGPLRASLRTLPDATEWLTRALAHSDRTTRIGAMRAAAALKAAPLAPRVVEAVDDGESAEAAARTLTRLGLQGALALIEGDDPPILALGPSGRAVASEAITRVGEPVLVPHLERLMRAGDPELAEVATRALGRCRTPRAIAPLLEALSDDALASAAARALGRLGASFHAEVIAALGAVPSRPHTLRAIVQIDGPNAADAVRAASHDGDDALRAAAAEAVTVLPAAEAAEALGRAMADEATVVRKAAVRTLVHVGREAAAPLLARALRDAEPAVVAAACDAAAELKLPATTARLAGLLAAPEGFVVLAALQALASLGALDDALGHAVLGHADPEVVKAALALLAARAMCAEHAVKLLVHPRWDVRAAAARALAVAGDSHSVGTIRDAALRETDSMARQILQGVVEGLERG